MSKVFIDDSVDFCLLEEFNVPIKIKDLLSNVHNEVTGHHGVEKTLLKLKQKGEKMYLYATACETFYSFKPILLKDELSKNINPYICVRSCTL